MKCKTTLRSVLFNSFNKMTIAKDCRLSKADISYIVTRLIYDIEHSNFTAVERFLFVEDGSCDTDDLESLCITNPEIKVIVVRQGGRMPELKEVNNVTQ